ncbi:hypothetical protein ABZ816_07220 [Actinosynnema sp. NPDC047251]|uniref:Uncharacterized protein n=1 Tax=Saccharothrix espanaensis (strain ATCC 51144 / DSM 44229 / JCM 9112 / NBRC 15066 / NRRL 15764) TaxID=1179773 RepID=K0JR58_SACES|nr:hypothetical protein [Saccharothrix espanaensis]CCH27752.1 hypothetical protein BN6_04210 [Saccharothrix espanaensis DSM 44229]
MPQGVRAVTELLIALDGRPDTRDLGTLAVRAFRAAPRPTPATAEAIAELAEVAGWILFEEERQAEAHAHNLAALALARPGGDVATLTLLTMAMQRAHVGRFAEALDLADRGAAGTRSPKVRAMFALRRARAHSRTGRAADALRALDQAEAVLEADATAPPWAWWIDRTELLGHRAAVLANLGRLEEAAATFPADDDLRFREVVRAMRYRTLKALGRWDGPPPTFRSPRAVHAATGIPGVRYTRRDASTA